MKRKEAREKKNGEQKGGGKGNKSQMEIKQEGEKVNMARWMNRKRK